MGSKEDSVPAEPNKSAAATQELPSTPSYRDWPTPLPVYYGAGATPSPAFYPPTVSSPAPHPYLWGSQHLMPPYGTPLPYPPIYPHGGLYAHPSMAPATAMAPAEVEGKPSDGKDPSALKKSKSSVGITGGKSVDEKAPSASADDAASNSGESGSENSSGASDENTSQPEFAANRKRSFNQMLADVDSSLATRGATNLPVSVPGKPAVTLPATNLNIGMDLWNASPAGGAPVNGRSNATAAPSVVVPPGMTGNESLWINDDRELKREKRKQSNRESARRSRLRKQAEYEELAAKVETLNNENRALRDELQRLAEECEKLSSENSSVKDQLTRFYGSDVTSGTETKDSD